MTDAPLRIDDTELHVQGDGPHTIVMLHGWPDTYRLWDAQVAAFSPHYRCVRFTLPGFDVRRPRGALSLDEMVAFIARVVDTTSPQRPVILLLHDWGCLFGYEYAMRHPARVQRIVGADVGDAGSTAHVRSLSAKAKAMTLVYQGWLLAAWRIGGRTGDAMTRRMARLARAPADPAHVGACMNFPYDIAWTGSHGGYRQRLPVEPACPMLFVYGERKPFMFHSPSWLELLAQRADHRVVALPTGHWVMHHRAPAFNAAVLDWLQATEGAAAA